MQNNYQSSSGFRDRSRKYDTYIPPTVTGRDAIAYEPAPAQQQTSPYDIAVHHSASPQTQAKTSLDFVPVKQQPAPKKKMHIVLPHKKKKPLPARKTLFSGVIRATVELEKVTRQSMQAVKHTFEPPEVVALRTRRQRMVVRTFYAVGAFSFVLAIGLAIKVITSESPKQRTNTGVLGLQTAAQNDAMRASEAPTETKPTKQDFDTYLVAQPYPRYLRIPSIGVESRVRRLGLDSKNAVGSPNSIYDTGWYDGSVRPGEVDGSSIIVGHVAGPSQQGVFWNLSRLEVGASIEIEKGNGQTLKYRVTKVDKLPPGDLDMTKYIKTDVAGKHDVKLITSAGKYAEISEQFAGRVVVTAELN